jgi:hypothetical protein
MRSRADVVLVFILVLALVGAPIWIVASSQAFRQCILYSSRDVGQNLFVVAYHWLRIGTDCTGKLANDNQGAASAVAGGVGVIVAIAVMFVYRRQATLMDLQARTMERQAGIMERQADITERQENLQRAWLIAGMGAFTIMSAMTKRLLMTKILLKKLILWAPTGDHSCTAILIFAITGKPALSSDIWNTDFVLTLPHRSQIGSPANGSRSNWIDTSKRLERIEVKPSHEMPETGKIIFYGRLHYLDVLSDRVTVALSTVGAAMALTMIAWAVTIGNTSNGSKGPWLNKPSRRRPTSAENRIAWSCRLCSHRPRRWSGRSS